MKPFRTRLGRQDLRFGAGAVDEIGSVVRSLGAKQPLVVTDDGLRESGHLDRVLRSLAGAGYDAAVFDAVEPNPDTELVARAAEAARGAKADLLLGLGGGSSMDCAKGLNFLRTDGGDMESFRGYGKVRGTMLPAVGIPTTAGTGSEAQSYAVISRAGTKEKIACGDPGALFRSVILDPELVGSAPAAVVTACAVDAVSHALESHVSTRANPISRLYSGEAWRRLSTAFGELLDGRRDVETWAEMQLGAYLAGAAIEHSMLGAAHACANPLTARYGVVHGIAVGLMLPHVIRSNRAGAGAVYRDLGDAEAPLDGRFEAWWARCRLDSRLRDYHVPRSVLEELAADAAEQWTGKFNPVPLDRGGFLRLYESAW